MPTNAPMRRRHHVCGERLGGLIKQRRTFARRRLVGPLLSSSLLCPHSAPKRNVLASVSMAKYGRFAPKGQKMAFALTDGNIYQRGQAKCAMTN